MRSMTRFVLLGGFAATLAACASGGGGEAAAGGDAAAATTTASAGINPRGGAGFGPMNATITPVLASSGQDVSIAQKAHVMIIEVLRPQVDDGTPVLFRVKYPTYSTDQLEFEPNRHRLVSRQRTAAEPPRCQGAQTASLQGCRPYLNIYPGVGGLTTLSGYYSTAGYIMIASPEFIDPYETADALFARTRGRVTLANALKTGNVAAAQAELNTVLGTLGTSWAGFYRPPS